MHHFVVEEATTYGVEPAILLTNIRFWLQKAKANNSHCYDGFWWTYNSAKAFSELFPYMSRQSITRYLKQLCDVGILKKSSYNQAGYDRTYWYTIPSEFSCDPSKINIAQNELSIAQNESPIPIVSTVVSTVSSVVSASEEKKSANEKTEFQSNQNQNQQTPKNAHEWIAYFVNKHGFMPHEAQTSKTVPMYVEWVKQGYTLEDVEMGIMGAMGWLSQRGDTRANSPYLFDGFIKSAISARQSQQAQKSPDAATNNNQGLKTIPSNSGINYDTQYQQPQRKLSLAEQAADATRRGIAFCDRFEYWVNSGFNEEDAKERARHPELYSTENTGFVYESYATAL